MVGYNVQAAVDARHHLIAAHEVTNVGTDRSQLSHTAKRTKAALGTDTLDVLTQSRLTETNSRAFLHGLDPLQTRFPQCRRVFFGQPRRKAGHPNKILKEEFQP